MTLRRLPLILVLLISGCATEPAFQPLFNGRDLTGWVNVNTAPSTWTVRDGIIISTCIPTGVLCTERQYENYVLELEWRHMTEGGNAGLFVHSDGLPARGVPFTRSIEAQILDGNHGDVFAIHGATMVPDRPHPRGWLRSLPVEERANPTGEWNHYRVESRDGTLTLAVNGKAVSGGTELNPQKGYVCLEAEGAEAHFRDIRIIELPTSNPAPDVTAEVYQGFTSLYSGVDLAGWIGEDGWSANDWRLDGSESASPLWTQREYGDFDMIVDWQGGCAAIYLRGDARPLVHARCEEPAGEGGVDVVPVEEGWNRLDLVLRDGRLRVSLNGVVVANQLLPEGWPARGPIGVDARGAGVEFANLFLRE